MDVLWSLRKTTTEKSKSEKETRKLGTDLINKP